VGIVCVLGRKLRLERDRNPYPRTERYSYSHVYPGMIRLTVAAVWFASANALFAQATPASLETPPPALQLFERDWVLMHWALKGFDMNRDILLQPDEASAAAQAFRKLADADGDGRVTPEEYQKARETILMGG
jgi:hypothetical protein